ncbi:probable leucine--tRNA ligase, mitochondrial, partial [Pollicipes pollicipes]|uniref:probable leucine--tRNA ligase, mitochondrial n=1 Tax=Pollicipes pollicipes TaxID=41117 RepID=UPI001884C6F8
MALRSPWPLRKRPSYIRAVQRLLFTETGVWGELTNSERLAAERAWLARVSAAPAPPEPGQPSAYVLAMFPYPSGRLHMGHVRVYAISDAVARFHRLMGKQVIHPMGWDAFGLPGGECRARAPLPADEWTHDNIAHMRRQLERMACCFDWGSELTTCRPDYYRWTQWLFLRLYRAGLVYRREALVNWDPADGTVLADEQVDEQGRSWRSGALVERRHLRQWFVRTTRFSERLRRSLDSPQLRDWRDIVQLQKHWIGECDGWKFELKVEDTTDPDSRPDPLLLWTADPRRFARASFIGLRSEHALARRRPSGGGAATPLSALNPATGGRLPLLVSDALTFPDGADALPRLPASGGGGGSPLLEATDWLKVDCPSCGGPAQRETDTMDTFVDSSWYYLRFLDPHNSNAPFDPDKVNAHMPVDIYVGGKEHAVLHLYYARFIHHFLHSLGLVTCEEPFSRLLVQGQVMGQSYRVTETGRYLRPNQVQMSESGDAVDVDSGRPVTVQWEKMSKSKHNGVDPAEVIGELGADTMRLLMLGTVAPTSSRHWSSDSFPPLLAWQRRLWMTVGDLLRLRSAPAPPAGSGAGDEVELTRLEAEMRETRNYFVRTVTLNFQETHQLSVAITRLQGLTTALRRLPAWYQAQSAEYERALGDLLIMTSPVMPCLAAEMWAAFTSVVRHAHPSHQQDCTVLEQRWP